MTLKVKPSFERDAKKAPKHIVSQLHAIFSLIVMAKSLSEIPNIKKLSGYKNAYRIRIDEYRIGFLFENKVIILTRLLRRKDIYKHFP